jgi:hypothetical protein
MMPRVEFSAASTHHRVVVVLRQGPVGVDAGSVWVCLDTGEVVAGRVWDLRAASSHES